MLGLRKKSRFSEFFVKHSKPHDRQRCKYDIVPLVNDRLVKSLSTKCGRKTKPVLGYREENILVKHIHSKCGISSIIFTSMVENEGSQKLKLRNCVV